jgi:hypothetical protein
MLNLYLVVVVFFFFVLIIMIITNLILNQKHVLNVVILHVQNASKNLYFIQCANHVMILIKIYKMLRADQLHKNCKFQTNKYIFNVDEIMPCEMRVLIQPVEQDFKKWRYRTEYPNDCPYVTLKLKVKRINRHDHYNFNDGEIIYVQWENEFLVNHSICDCIFYKK